jgi:sigma-E factor negative regulatory protein RseA
MKPGDSSRPYEQRQALSALMDGDGSAADLALQTWGSDASARADWHAFHLIGELMRSDDVRCTPVYDARFLAGLRERLTREPVVLAPSARAREDVSAPSGQSRRAWVGPAAIAAGFVAVAGVMVLIRSGAPEGAVQDRSARLANQGAAPAASAGASGSDGGLIRNVELDRYLAAHRQYSNSSALAAPGGLVRSTAVAAPGR